MNVKAFHEILDKLRSCLIMFLLRYESRYVIRHRGQSAASGSLPSNTGLSEIKRRLSKLRPPLLLSLKFFHYIGCVLEKHNIVDRHIYNSVLEIHIPLIGQHIGFLDVIVII